MSDPVVFDANLPAIWLESMIYGVYSCLFFQTLIIARRRSPRSSRTAQVFQNATVVLYIIATFHVAVGLYRLIRGFIYTAPDVRLGYWYGVSWDNTAYYASQSVMSYISQALLIYRCFTIYNNNWLIITPSLILYCANIGISIYVNYTWSVVGAPLASPGLVNSILPLSLVQHMFTPCLTVYRLLRQHHDSRRSGLPQTRARLNLQTVSMIILESTMIYIVVIISALILNSLHSNDKQIPIVISTPTLGVCFSLITIRLHNLNRYESQEKSTVFSVGQFVFNTHTFQTNTTDVAESELQTTGDTRTEDTKTLNSTSGIPKFHSHPDS